MGQKIPVPISHYYLSGPCRGKIPIRGREQKRDQQEDHYSSWGDYWEYKSSLGQEEGGITHGANAKVDIRRDSDVKGFHVECSDSTYM